MEQYEKRTLRGFLSEILWQELKRFVEAVRKGEHDKALQLCVSALASGEGPQAFRAYVDTIESMKEVPFATIGTDRIYFSIEKSSVFWQKPPVFWLRDFDSLEMAVADLEEYRESMGEGQGSLIPFEAKDELA